MHPQYIGRPGRLLMLERLIEYIQTFPNVEFMRAVDVARMEHTPWNPTPSVSETPDQRPSPGQPPG